MARTTNLSTGITRVDLVYGHAEWREGSYVVGGDRCRRHACWARICAIVV